MKKILFLILVISLISCGKETPKTFSLTGTTSGLADGTLLFLDHNNQQIDSTIVTNNRFTFNTKLPSTPIDLWLRVEDFSKYRSFWAENNPMTFDATKTDFKSAIIKGSKTEDLSFSLYQKVDSLSYGESLKIEKEFVKQHPNSIISASILSVYATTWGIEDTRELYEQFSAENKNSMYGKEIANYIELFKNPKIGAPFVDVAMQDPSGTVQKLSDLRGKTILLEFWASWCGPCREENPNLVKTYEAFHSKGFEIYAVSLDQDKNSWMKAIQKDGLPWKHVSDLKGSQNKASLTYGISGIPDNFLISETGEIIARNLRGDKLDEKLAEILASK
jgi:peroxiredoxin